MMYNTCTANRFYLLSLPTQSFFPSNAAVTVRWTPLVTYQQLLTADANVLRSFSPVVLTTGTLWSKAYSRTIN